MWFVRYKNIFNRYQNLTCVTNTVLVKKKVLTSRFPDKIWDQCKGKMQSGRRYLGTPEEELEAGPLAIGAD